MKARVFNIMQYEYHPFDAYDEDGNLLPDAEPLLQQEQIDDGLNHRSIKRWAYAWHDLDVYSEEDEEDNPRKRAGETKPRHVHIVLECPNKVELSSVAKWFGVPEQYVDVPKGRGAFLDCVKYLTHEDEKQQELGKTFYPDEVVVANFDWRTAVDNIAHHRFTPADVMRMHVLEDGWTLRQARESDPLTYSKIRSGLQPLRVDYLQRQPPAPLRINIYVDGPGGIGKSAYCQYIAQELFRGDDDPLFWVGSDERVTFDGYDGQPVIIWDDWRVSDFIKQFKPQGTYKILDPHPKPVAQQAKYSRVILTNAVNIINGVQPYDEFIAGLAGTYTDKRTGIHYQAEDDTQAWRRFPMILCVHEDDFDVLLNEGFVNNDMSAIKTMGTYAHVRGSMKQIMQHLEGEAKETVLLDFSRPVFEAVDKVKESQRDKISDPALIPPEFADYGKVMTDEEVKQLRENKLIDKAEDYVTRRDEAVLDFAYWFWDDIRERVPSLAHDYRKETALVNERNVRAALDRYVNREVVKTFPFDSLVQVVGWVLQKEYDDGRTEARLKEKFQFEDSPEDGDGSLGE